MWSSALLAALICTAQAPVATAALAHDPGVGSSGAPILAGIDAGADQESTGPGQLPSADPTDATVCKHAPDRLLVRFTSGASRAQKTTALHGARATRSFRSRLVAGLESVRVAGNARAAAKRLAAMPMVRSVEPDCELRIADTPDDPDFAKLWGLRNTGQTGGAAGADIDAVGAWDVRTDARAVTIAVIDTGVQVDHPDLAANLWTNPDEVPANGLDDDQNGFIDDVHGWDFVNNRPVESDDNGHGTHVAGTIAGVGNNGIGVTGVAWQAQIMSLKAFNASGVGNVSAVIAALDYAADNGAQVINASFGGSDFMRVEYDAYVALGALDVLTVAAAGNSAQNADERPHYPAAFDLESVISVAASTASDDLAQFSNHGVWNVDLAAPGDGIWSTLPGGGYGFKSGTSMATPHVTGVTALLLAEHPSWTAADVRDRILGTTRPVAALGGKTLTGGVLDAGAALSSTPSVPLPAPDPVPAPLAVEAIADPNPAPVDAPPAPAFPEPEVIDSTTADVFGPPVIALDNAGTPHIAYTQRYDGVHVARLAGAAWTDRRITEAYDDLYWLGLAVDDDGVPLVAVQRRWSSLSAFWDPGVVMVRGTDTPVESRLTASCPDLDSCFGDWRPRVVYDGDGAAHAVFTRSVDQPQDGVAAPAGSAPPASGAGLYYATNRSGTWLVTRLTAGSFDGPADLAIASDGAVHIVVPRKAGSATGLYHVTDASGSWSADLLTHNVQDRNPNIAVDAAGNLAVSFSRHPLGVYFMSRPASGDWTQPGRIYDGAALDQDLAVDGAGRPSVAFGITDAWQTAAGIRYATLRNGTWSLAQVAGGQALMPSLALSDDGTAHVAYYQGLGAPFTGIQYATNAPGPFVASLVAGATGGTGPGYIALASDRYGNDHIAMAIGQGSPDVGLYYGTNASGAWAFTRIANWADNVAIAIDRDGRPIIAFAEMIDPVANAVLPQSQWRVAVATPASGGWSIEMVAGGANMSSGGVAVVAGTNGPRVLFVGRDGTRLMLAEREGAGWAYQTIHEAASIREASAVADSEGVLHVAVGETRSGTTWPQVAYVHGSAGVWHQDDVTTGPAWHESPRIAIAPDGNLWITDWKPVDGGVEVHRRNDDGTWAADTVATGAADGWPTIAVDELGAVHVVYARGTFYGSAGCTTPMCPSGAGLRHAVLDGEDWTTTRLTPYWHDTAPMLALGGDGSLEVVFVRSEIGIRSLPLAQGRLVAALVAPASPTNAASLSFSIILNRPVVDVAVEDLAVGGTAVGCSVDGLSGAGTSWSVVLKGCSEGTVTLTLRANSVTEVGGQSGPPEDVSSQTVTIDTSAPTVTLTAVNGSVRTFPYTSATAIGSLGGACTTADGLVSVTIDGTAASPATAACSGGAWSLTLAPPLSAGGSHLLVASQTDAAGNTASSDSQTVTIDTTAPKVTTPSYALRSGISLSGTSVPVKLRWTGSDVGSGLVAFDLERSRDGGMTWTPIALPGMVSAFDTYVPSSGSTLFRVRAVDRSGLKSAWALTAPITSRLVQQTSGVRWAGRWTVTKDSRLSGGSARYSKSRGASATVTFTGRTVGLVATRSPSRGKARIYVNGHLVATVSLQKSSTQFRALAWSKTFSTSATRTLRIVVVGTAGHPRVDVDAIVVVK